MDFPAEALKAKTVKEIRLELAYIPSPYHELDRLPLTRRASLQHDLRRELRWGDDAARALLDPLRDLHLRHFAHHDPGLQNAAPIADIPEEEKRAAPSMPHGGDF